MSPWVNVGPSSTTRTRLPRTASGSSHVTFEFALTTRAPGLTSAIVPSSCATCSGVAESILLITITPAARRLVSPGW
jgi:hypothetical protein